MKCNFKFTDYMSGASASLKESKGAGNYSWSDVFTLALRGVEDDGYSVQSKVTKHAQFGTGKKIHLIICTVVTAHDKEHIVHADSYCGSLQYNTNNPSSMHVLNSDHDVDCKKCLKRLE